MPFKSRAHSLSRKTGKRTLGVRISTDSRRVGSAMRKRGRRVLGRLHWGHADWRLLSSNACRHWICTSGVRQNPSLPHISVDQRSAFFCTEAFKVKTRGYHQQRVAPAIGSMRRSARLSMGSRQQVSRQNFIFASGRRARIVRSAKRQPDATLPGTGSGHR
jgi:hypothetical protein